MSDNFEYILLKGFEDAEQEAPQEPANNDVPPEGGESDQQESGEMMNVNPFNVDDPNIVMNLINQVATMKDQDLLALSYEIWGDGYEYKPINQGHVRGELRGFLQDQIELLNASPAVAMMGFVQQMPPANLLPHTSGSSPGSRFGPEGEESLSKDEPSQKTPLTSEPLTP